MAEVGCLRDGNFQNLEVGGIMISGKRKVYNKPKATAEKTFTTADSGTLVVLGSTQGQIQVFNLPTIATAADLGTYFDFIVTVSGAGGSAGSYTINTGGSNTDPPGAPTKGYDDFIGVLDVVDSVDFTHPADAASNIIPSPGEGTLVLALDNTNGTLGASTHFRVTAVDISTTTAGANVWFIQGTFVTTQAAGLVTDNIFT